MGIILASQSPRRKEILMANGIDFQIVVSEADESCSEADPIRFVETLAERKAEAVSSKVSTSDIIISADTVVVCSSSILGKPKNRADAENMLNMLSGNMHRVITGVCLKKGNQKLVSHDITNVYFKQLSLKEISDYLDTNEFADKAGSYAIQGLGGKFVDRIEGSYTNVVGLPEELTLELLENIRNR